MSRTDKHAPHFAQLNDIGEPALAHHDHGLFGQPKIEVRTVRDRDGKVQWHDVPIMIAICTILASRPEFLGGKLRAEVLASQVIARRALAKGADPRDIIDTGRTRRAKVTREVKVGRYADYCTAGIQTHRDGRIHGERKLYAPCTNQLGLEDWGTTFGRSRAEKRFGYHLDPRRPSRNGIRGTRTQLTRLADNGEDLDDIDYDVTR